MPPTKDPVLLIIGEIRVTRNKILKLDAKREELVNLYREQVGKMQGQLELPPPVGEKLPDEPPSATDPNLNLLREQASQIPDE